MAVEECGLERQMDDDCFICNGTTPTKAWHMYIITHTIAVPLLRVIVHKFDIRLCCDRSKLWCGELPLRHRPTKCTYWLQFNMRTPFGKALFANQPHRHEPICTWSQTNNAYIIYLCHWAHECYTTYTNASHDSHKVIASTLHSRNVAGLMDLFCKVP